MRTYQDAKAMAKSLRELLAARSVPVSHSESLEIVARQFGFDDWNTLSSKLGKERASISPPELLSHPPPTANKCQPSLDEGTPAIAVFGDLKTSPAYVVDWRPGVLSEPINLPANGTYRIVIRPEEPRGRVLEWITCRSCSHRGSILNIALANEPGTKLGSVKLVTLPHCFGVAIFGHYGVMLQTMPRRVALEWPHGSEPATFTTRTWSTGEIDRV